MLAVELGVVHGMEKAANRFTKYLLSHAGAPTFSPTKEYINLSKHIDRLTGYDTRGRVNPLAEAIVGRMRAYGGPRKVYHLGWERGAQRNLDEEIRKFRSSPKVKQDSRYHSRRSAVPDEVLLGSPELVTRAQEAQLNRVGPGFTGPAHRIGPVDTKRLEFGTFDPGPPTNYMLPDTAYDHHRQYIDPKLLGPRSAVYPYGKPAVTPSGM